MSVIALQCPHCGGALQVDSSMAGRRVNCPLCQRPMTVPGAQALATGGSDLGLTPPPLPPATKETAAAASGAPPKTIVVPLPSGGSVTLQDRRKVIRAGRREIEIRRLAPEEKSERRFWKNVILWVGCVLLLLALCYFLANRG